MTTLAKVKAGKHETNGHVDGTASAKLGTNPSANETA